MVYNKTKRNLEKAAGIVGVVLSSIFVIVSFIATLSILFEICLNGTTSLQLAGYDYNGNPYYISINDTALYVGFFFGLFTAFAFSLVLLILCAKVIKTPVQDDGAIKKRTGIRICIVVFSILCGNLVTAGLMIAVLCLKDVKQPKTPANQVVAKPTTVQPVVNTASEQSMVNRLYNFNAQSKENLELCEKLSELKHLKVLGVVDELTFKKCVNKIVEDYFKEN